MSAVTGLLNRGPARRVKREVKQYMLRRKRARVARKKRAGSRKATIMLALVLAMLFGAFGWSQSYLTTPAEGVEVSMDQLKALAKEDRIASATFLDEDNRLVGRFTSPMLIQEEEPAEKKEADAKKGDEPKKAEETKKDDGAKKA